MEMKLELSCNNATFTANIFYRMLCETMKNKRKAGDNFRNRGTNKLTQTHLFYDLNVLIDSEASELGTFEYLLNGNTLQGGQKNAARKFRYGVFTASKSDIYRFNNTQIQKEFDQQVKSEYSEVFKKAVEFAKRYFDDNESARNTALIQKVLFLLLNDNNISDSQEFYICSDGSTKTKAELRTIDTIEFEAFLLGVWHYLIITQKLQADLKEISKIIVNTTHKQKKIELTYSTTDTYSSTDLLLRSSKKSARHIIRRNRPVVCNYDEEYIPDGPELDEIIGEIYQYQEYNTNIIDILENNNVVLSRNIFFYLLSDNIKTVHPKRNKLAIEKLFLCLINLTNNNGCSINFNKNFEDNCSDYFSDLKDKYSLDFLDDKTCITDFSKILRFNYADVLLNMVNIRKKFFNSNKYNEIIVVSIIEFIRNDNTIDDNQEFYVCSDGSTLTKSQLCEIEEIEFEPFLIGMWYYVISQLDAKDCNDKQTFETVFEVKIEYDDEEYIRIRPTDLIEEQSEQYVELIYF